MGRACSKNAEKGNVYTILVRKSEGKETTRKTMTLIEWITLKWILER
jgi:hypothetical protein